MVTKGPLSLTGKDLVVKRIGKDLTAFDGIGYLRARLLDVLSKVDGRQAIEKRNIPTLVATPTCGTTFGTLNP